MRLRPTILLLALTLFWWGLASFTSFSTMAEAQVNSVSVLDKKDSKSKHSTRDSTGKFVATPDSEKSKSSRPKKPTKSDVEPSPLPPSTLSTPSKPTDSDALADSVFDRIMQKLGSAFPNVSGSLSLATCMSQSEPVTTPSVAGSSAFLPGVPGRNFDFSLVTGPPTSTLPG